MKTNLLQLFNIPGHLIFIIEKHELKASTAQEDDHDVNHILNFTLLPFFPLCSFMS